MNEILTWLLDAVQSVDPGTRILISGVAMLLETSVLIGLVVPGDTVVIVSSTATVDLAGYLWLVVAIVIGSLAGESIGFALGRYFGPRIRASRLGQRVGERQWKLAENYTDRRAGLAVFISRFLPVLHSLVPLTAGMSTMRYRLFMAWATPACIVWALSYAGVGWLAAGSYRELSTQLHWAGYIFVAVIVVFIALVALAKKLLVRSQAHFMEKPGDGDANTRDAKTSDAKTSDE